MDYFQELVPELMHIDNALPDDISIQEDVYNLIRCKYLERYLDKDTLNSEDFSILEEIAKEFNGVSVQPDVHALVTSMAFKAREKSNGAVSLNRVFLSPSDYEGAFKDYNSKEISINRVKVCKSNVKSSLAIGLCKPKYKIIDPSMMIFLGRLQDKTV